MIPNRLKFMIKIGQRYEVVHENLKSVPKGTFIRVVDIKNNNSYKVYFECLGSESTYYYSEREFIEYFKLITSKPIIIIGKS